VKSSIEIREEIGRQYDRAQAIIDVARAAKRDLSDEETAEIDKINGSGDPKATGYKAGVIDKLKGELQRAENIEAREAELTALRQPIAGKKLAQSGDGAPTTDGEEEAFTRASRIKVPAQARYHHASLKTFKGADAEAQAYLTGQFLLATIGKSEHAHKWCKEHGVDVRFRGALKESDNSLGGFLVPIEMERSIIALREERGVLRREAMVVPMASDTLQMPRRSSGVTAYWTGELAEIQASNPTLDSIELTAKKLAALVRMSSEVNEDTVISLADFVTQEIAYAFADKEDLAGFNGDGTSTYGGIIGVKNALLAGSEYEALAGNTAFSTLDLVDFESMIGMLPLYALQDAKWYISRAGWAASMQRLADAAGGNTTQNIMGGVGASFLGFPVVWVQVMNSTLTAQTSAEGACYFGSMRQGVKLGTRRGMSIQTSTDRYFETDEIGIKATQRLDIVVSEKGTATAAGSLIGLKFPGA
jgi:HK97 family phage major capsid protein